MNRLFGILPFLTAVFIDLFSFGLMYPVIVILFRHFGAQHAYTPATLNVLLSLTFALFPFGMFFGASLLGDLSDALGRRRTLLICMTGLTLSYALMFLGVESSVIGLLLAGRLLSGLMAGAAPIAQAAMMDHSTPELRGRDMSRVVLVNCLAIASAPAIGGVLTDVWLPLPMLFTVLLCLGAFALILRARLPETAPRAALNLSWGRPITNFVLAAQHPRIRWLALAFFLFQLGFSIYFVYVLVMMGQTYHLEPSWLGIFSATIGVGMVAGSTLGYRFMARKLPGDAAIAALALGFCGLMIVLAASGGEIAQWPFAFLASVANCCAYISLLALLSAAAGAERQGWAMGIGSAAVALAFFLSGLLASLLAFIPLPAILAIGGVLVMLGAAPLWQERQA